MDDGTLKTERVVLMFCQQLMEIEMVMISKQLMSYRIKIFSFVFNILGAMSNFRWKLVVSLQATILHFKTSYLQPKSEFTLNNSNSFIFYRLFHNRSRITAVLGLSRSKPSLTLIHVGSFTYSPMHL